MKKKSRFGENGFTMVEVLLAIAVFVLIGMTSLYLLTARTNTIEDTATSELAVEKTEEALANLTAKAADMLVGGSFTPGSDNNITPTGCTSANCDIILIPNAPESLSTSPAGGVPFSPGYAPPNGYYVKFYRMWRVDDTDDIFRLRKITVAMAKSLDATEGVVVQSTTTGMPFE